LRGPPQDDTSRVEGLGDLIDVREKGRRDHKEDNRGEKKIRK